MSKELRHTLEEVTSKVLDVYETLHRRNPNHKAVSVLAGVRNSLYQAIFLLADNPIVKTTEGKTEK